MPHQSGLKISGLDLNNSPAMVMGGGNVMNMNGSDASAAAGFNTTTPNWHYDGPTIPQAEANKLLTDGRNSPTDIQMAVSGCAPSLTAAENIGAAQYVQATSSAVTPFAQPSAALAAGYVPASPTDYPVVTYVNPTIVAANAAAKRTLDPKYVDGLVYATTPAGTDVLVAAMYILPSTVTTVPMPYGALGAVASPHAGLRARPRRRPTCPSTSPGSRRARAARPCGRRPTCPWCGRSRWRVDRLPFSRRTFRSWRRPS